jgi:hypothetical protein
VKKGRRKNTLGDLDPELEVENLVNDREGLIYHYEKEAERKERIFDRLDKLDQLLDELLAQATA